MTMAAEVGIWKAISSLLHGYTQETSLHAVSHVTDNKRGKFRRFIWSIFFLGLVGLWLYFVVDRVQKYLAYDVKSVVKYKRVDEIDLPSITLINFNYVNKTYIEQQDEALQKITSQNLPSPIPLDLTAEDFARLSQVDMVKQGMESGHTIDGTFKSLTFEGLQRRLDRDLLVSRMTSNGYGFSVHPRPYIEKNGTSLKVKNRGLSGGVNMLIDIHEELYYITGYNSAGIKVMVHDPDVEPLLQEEGLMIQPGTETHLLISKRIVERLPLPYNRGEPSCVDVTDPTFVNPLEHFDVYSLNACKLNCQIRFINSKIGCKLYWHNAPSIRTCSILELHDALRVQGEFNHDKQHLKNCNCFEPCKEVFYDVIPSQATYPNDAMINYIKTQHKDLQSYSDFQLRKNVIDLNIYFSDVGYTILTQEPAYEIIDLFSELGGLMGLCVGASLLTLCELMEFITMVFYKLCSTHTKSHKGEHNKVTVLQAKADHFTSKY